MQYLHLSSSSSPPPPPSPHLLTYVTPFLPSFLAAYFTPSCRILLLALPTSSSCVRFAFAEICGRSAWVVLFRPPFALFDFIAVAVCQNSTRILDLWCWGPCFLMHEVLVLYSLCLCLLVFTQKIHWMHGLADTVAPFLTIWQFTSELRNSWGSDLSYLCPSWITGQPLLVSLFPRLFFCLSFQWSLLLWMCLWFAQAFCPSALESVLSPFLWN